MLARAQRKTSKLSLIRHLSEVFRWRPRICAVLVACLALSACASSMAPQNLEEVLYEPSKSAELSRGELTFVATQCPPPGEADFIMPASSRTHKSDIAGLTMRYSPGDRFNILIPGYPDYSGDYVINADGRVILPFAGEIEAVGTTNRQLTERVRTALVDRELFNGDNFQISVRPVQFSPINVTVAGAVFLPGRFVINGIQDADKGEKALAKFGDSPIERFVPAALRAAGGIRPDADLSNVTLVRKNKSYRLDWRGAITGAPVDDVALLAGDHIQVGESSCFQSGLVRPSQITPPGIRIFSSNLTVPATSNASAGIGQHSENIPYGTRLLAGLVSANCVGGSMTTNAHRYAVLISRNPKTMKTEVIQRSIEQLVRSADRDSINPYLMPDDAIACYDSEITEMAELAKFAQTILAPIDTAHVFRNW